MKFQKIVCLNIDDRSLSQWHWDEITKLTDHLVRLPRDDPQIEQNLTDTDCLLVSFAYKVDKKMLDAAPNLKYIGLLASGFDDVDVDYATQKAIPVCNLHGFATESVAEFIIGSLLETMRDLEGEKQRGREGDFVYTEEGVEQRRELKGTTFGVIGLGSIGNKVAELASAFGAEVSYWSRHQKEAPFVYKDLDELIKSSAIISLNTSLAPETEHIISAERIAQIKPGSLLVNMGPMEMIDIDALASRLGEGDIKFISDHAELMEVSDIEKISKHKNCILYPPIGPITPQAQMNKQNIFVSNLKAFLQGIPQNKVN